MSTKRLWNISQLDWFLISEETLELSGKLLSFSPGRKTYSESTRGEWAHIPWCGDTSPLPRRLPEAAGSVRARILEADLSSYSLIWWIMWINVFFTSTHCPKYPVVHVAPASDRAWSLAESPAEPWWLLPSPNRHERGCWPCSLNMANTLLKFTLKSFMSVWGQDTGGFWWRNWHSMRAIFQHPARGR